MDQPFVVVPPSVASRAVELFGVLAAEAWCESATDSLQWACRRWHLELGEPIVSGRGGLVWCATAATGRPVVLKLPFLNTFAHFDAQSCLDVAGVGPRVLGRDDRAGVVMLEWVHGSPLSSTSDAAASTALVFSRLAGVAHKQALPGLPRLDKWLRGRLDGDRPVDVSPAAPVATDDQRAGALRLLNELGSSDGFCHGDLHSGNVLLCQSGEVWMVDARGVSGDVAYDAACFAIKANPGRRVGELLSIVSAAAASARLDVDRCRAWLCVARAAQV